METLAEIKAQVAKLRRDFNEHRHTGLDSKTVDLTDQIESQGTLTAQDNGTVDGTYGAEEAGVIDNLRTRVAELEAALIAYGILE